VNEMKMVYIKWRDACIQAGAVLWEDVQEHIDVESVGILIKETTTSICIAQQRFDDGYYRATLSIPKKYILKKRWLK